MAPQISPVDRQRIVGLWDAGHRIKEIEVLTGISVSILFYFISRYILTLRLRKTISYLLVIGFHEFHFLVLNIYSGYLFYRKAAVMI